MHEVRGSGRALTLVVVALQAGACLACRFDNSAEAAAEATSNGTGASASETPRSAPPAPSAAPSPSGVEPAATPAAAEATPAPTALAPAPVPAPNTSAGSDAPSATPPAAPATPPVPSPPSPAPLVGPVTLYLAGDSIVQSYAETASLRDQAGWGQMLGLHTGPELSVDNRAIGGRTARRFIDEGRLDEILDALLPGDYLLVQFGTNDGNRTATYTLGAETIPYFLDPATDFKSYLQLYIDAAREHDAIPVLVTPTPRNSAYCTGGNGTGGHAQAMRELGQAQGVSVVDLNTLSVNYLKAICPAPTPEDFFLLRADGSVDGTHFQENGARILAGFVASALRQVEPALASQLD